LNVIKQTNRTILLEEINPEKYDLLSIVGDVKGIDSVSDDKIKEINLHLECRNFDEFLEKFKPVVYSYYNANNQKVSYTLRKPENIPEELLTEIPLTPQNDFIKMLFTLLETKRAQGIINVDFGFENILDLISPKKVMDDIRQVRKEIRYNYSKYAELDDMNPEKLDLGDKLNTLFESASDHYNNVMAMLPLAIEDIKTRLLLGVDEQKKDNTPLALGMLTMGEKGELKILEAPKSEGTALATIDDNINTGLIEVLKEDYQALNTHTSSYVEDLVVRTFCPLTSTNQTSIDVETEVANYNTYLEFYKDAKDEFIKVVKPLVEKILGVKMFFEQYKVKSKGMSPVLVVANSSPEMLAKSSNIPSLLTYLNTTNSKNNFDQCIWYAIIPSVSLDQHSKMKVRRERFKGNSHKNNTDSNSMESLINLLDVLKDYRVEAFFSFETREETTFNAIASEGIEKFINRCDSLTGKSFSEFAIPCLPNFTVIPKNKSGVMLDKKMLINEEQTAVLSEEKEDIMKLWIEGVYIGASYVAAGFRAACQCPEFLKQHFRRAKADPQLPGVRYDVESGDNALRTCTTMSKEITGFTNTIKNQILRRNFGFFFSSENAVLDNQDITNIMVYKARNLLYDADNATYEPIYKTQVITYIERVLRHATGDFKQDNIIQFFSNNPKSQKSQWLLKKDCVNAIIAEGDSLEFTIDEASGICSLTMSFNGTSKNLEVEINRLSLNNI